MKCREERVGGRSGKSANSGSGVRFGVGWGGLNWVQVWGRVSGLTSVFGDVGR